MYSFQEWISLERVLLHLCSMYISSFYMKLSILIFEAEYSFPVITVPSGCISRDTSSLRLHKFEKEVKSVCHWYNIHPIKRCILGQGYTIERNLCLELHPAETESAGNPPPLSQET